MLEITSCDGYSYFPLAGVGGGQENAKPPGSEAPYPNLTDTGGKATISSEWSRLQSVRPQLLSSGGLLCAWQPPGSKAEVVSTRVAGGPRARPVPTSSRSVPREPRRSGGGGGAAQSGSGRQGWSGERGLRTSGRLAPRSPPRGAQGRRVLLRSVHCVQRTDARMLR